MKKLKLNADGRVQGVGFRYTTKMAADQLGVYGTVKNEWDGSVTIEVCGDDQRVDRFVERIRQSPSPAGNVTKLTIEENPNMEETDRFDVIY